MKSQTVAVIGGGAAGMMTVATLLEQGRAGEQIFLFEKNSRLGAKVIISGGGRCNLTTGNFKTKTLLTNYPRGAAFLRSAVKNFGPRAIRRWFERHGVATKQEDDGRIFPVSDDGKDVVRVFENLFTDAGVQVKHKEGVTNIAVKKSTNNNDICTNDVHISSSRIHISTSTPTPTKGRAGSTYITDHVVITTGGNAYAHTGSSGDGYAFARALGHTITPLGPSLNSFKTSQTRMHECSGIALERARISSVEKNEKNKEGKVYTASGPVLLTHFGISGPATFAFSSHIPYSQISKDTPYHVLLTPDTSLSMEARQHHFLDASMSTPKKELLTIIREKLPKKLAEGVCESLQIDARLPIGQMSKVVRKTLSRTLGEGIPLSLIQRRPGDEFVTAGGVTVSEVDPKSGQSLLQPGCWFAGEILDIDGYTGGYNLTASWAMGRLVGESIGN